MTSDTKPIADRYRIFAHFEAKGRSAAYEALAGFFADSEPCLQYVSQFPSDKQQPNLVFAALRQIAGVPDSQAADRKRVVSGTYEEDRGRLILAR